MIRFGAAATFATTGAVQPAFAKSKGSVSPNKPEGVGANAASYFKEQYKLDKENMAGDKGSRGTVIDKAIATNEASRAKALKVRPPIVADRTPRPEDLGLKQWSGN